MARIWKFWRDFRVAIISWLVATLFLVQAGFLWLLPQMQARANQDVIGQYQPLLIDLAVKAGLQERYMKELELFVTVYGRLPEEVGTVKGRVDKLEQLPAQVQKNTDDLKSLNSQMNDVDSYLRESGDMNDISNAGWKLNTSLRLSQDMKLNLMPCNEITGYYYHFLPDYRQKTDTCFSDILGTLPENGKNGLYLLLVQIGHREKFIPPHDSLGFSNAYSVIVWKPPQPLPQELWRVTPNNSEQSDRLNATFGYDKFVDTIVKEGDFKTVEQLWSLTPEQAVEVLQSGEVLQTYLELK